MAKRRRNLSRDTQHPSADDGTTQPTPGARATLGRTEEKIVDFAEDLGRLLGTAQRKASEWMGQRQAVVQQLQEIRSTADELLTQLTDRARDAAGIGGRGRGRRGAATSSTQPARRGRPPGRKKRTMSAEARERIAAAQRRRWAKVKRQRAKE